MKKFTLLVGLVAFLIGVATAQTTKVSKQIEMMSWLNKAVVDGNQVEGGLHTYANWNEVALNAAADNSSSIKLKTAQVQLGMLITLTGAADAGTYRLKSWTGYNADPASATLPLKSEWERIGDVVVVADIAARDELIDSDPAATDLDYALSVGTVVLVGDNGTGIPGAYIYVGGTIDVNGDGSATATDLWFNLSSSSTDAGYICYLDYTPVTSVYTDALTATVTSSTLTSGYFATSNTDATPVFGTITHGTSVKFTSKPVISAAGSNEITFDLTTITHVSGHLPLVAMPKSWGKPSFYIQTGTGTSDYSPLQDCWVSREVTIDNVVYQVWIADNDFVEGAGTTLKLIVR